MSDIIKTIESWRDPRRVKDFLTAFRNEEDASVAYGSMVQNRDDGVYVFQLGRGQPKQKPITRLWFVYRGRIYGSFRVAEIVRNDGRFQDLVTMYKRESPAKDWRLRDDNWVAVCTPPFEFHTGRRLFHDGFQGWRYFDLEAYRMSPLSMVRV